MSNNFEERNAYRNEKIEELRNSSWDTNDQSPRFVIQLIPEPEQSIDLDKEENKKTIFDKLKSIYYEGVSFEQEPSEDFFKVKNNYAYAKLYKDGKLEIVRASYSGSGRKTNNDELKGESKFIDIKYEKEVKEAIRIGLDLLEALNVTPPLFLSFTLLDSKGYRLKKKSVPLDEYSPKEIDAENNDIRSGEYIIPTYEAGHKNTDNYLTPSFEYIRRLVGWS